MQVESIDRVLKTCTDTLTRNTTKLSLFFGFGERGRVVGRKLFIMRGSTFDPRPHIWPKRMEQSRKME